MDPLDRPGHEPPRQVLRAWLRFVVYLVAGYLLCQLVARLVWSVARTALRG